MIYFINYGDDRRKYVTPVLSAEDFDRLRNSESNISNVRLAREGDVKAKKRLVQFCYNSLHPTDLLKGESYLNRFFAFDYDDAATRETFINKVSEMRSELGALMLERSVHGAHAVFLRHKGESIEEGCQRISRLTGFPYDRNCKDLNRVVFGTTSTKDDLIFCYDTLFEPVEDLEEARRETEEVMRRAGSQESRNSGTTESRNPGTQESGDLGTQELTDAQREIIEGTFRICGHEPEEVCEGMRHMVLFDVAMKLRHWVGFKEERLLPLLYPHYSFGLEMDEVRGIVHSAVTEEHGYAPKAFKALVEKVEDRKADEGEPDTNAYDPIREAYRPFEEAVADEVLMPGTPKLMKTILKAAPYGYKYPVMAATCPAACTLLTDVRMKYGSKKPKRMNSWTHLDGQFSSNKGLMIQPNETLLYELQQQDDANQAKMNEVMERNRLNRNKETLEKVPELPIRIIEAGTTRKQHIIMMKNAHERHTFTMCDELDSLKSRGSGYYDRRDFERLMFDNGKVCSRTAVDDSPNISSRVVWNLCTSSTRGQTLDHWRSATDGAVSRVWFVLMPDNVFAPQPKYYQYTTQEKEYISRASLIMMKMKGLLLTPKLDDAMHEWNERVRLEAMASNNRERAMLKNRAQEIAHTFGGVLHCMSAVQEIIDREDEGFASEEERLEWEKTAYDPNRYSEKPNNIRMAIYCADRILDEQESLWGRSIMDQTISACARQKGKSQTNRDFSLLPKGTFTITDVAKIFPERRATTLEVMLSRFARTGLLNRLGKDGKKTVYEKAA